MTIKVIVNGANGKMGQVTVDAVSAAPDLELVAALDHQDNLAKAIEQHSAQVVIDFTVPTTVYNNTKTIILCGAHPVIGTTGLTLDQIHELQKLSAEKALGGIIAPNFSLGAILMMRYAQDAARYFPDVEIIEMHHEKKIDAPSGTAAKTAEMIATTRNPKHTVSSDHQRARGDQHQGVTIHSVRLPGLFAHQCVLFGGIGETLTIRHDGMNRNAMMPGVILSCRKVMELNHLVYGLENILD